MNKFNNFTMSYITSIHLSSCKPSFKQIVFTITGLYIEEVCKFTKSHSNQNNKYIEEYIESLYKNHL